MARDGDELTHGVAPEGKPGSTIAEKHNVPQSISVLVAARFIIALGYGLIAPILPQFAQSFNVGVAAAGAVISIFAFSRLAFAPVSGRLVDRLGSRRIYLSGLLIVAGATGLGGFVGEYWAILRLRLVAGIGSTVISDSTIG